MFDDIRRIRRSSKDLAEASGRPSSMADRVANLPADLAWSADAAEFAATQSRDAAAGVERIEGGLPGVAVLAGGFRATGELQGYLPVGLMDLDIHLDGRPPYRETVRVVVPHDRLTWMTNGRRLRVEVDPADRTRVLIDWTSEA
jgi:hypothetical protein